jgi:hypothetical protein
VIPAPGFAGGTITRLDRWCGHFGGGFETKLHGTCMTLKGS